MKEPDPHDLSEEQNMTPTGSQHLNDQTLYVAEHIQPLLQPIIEQLNQVHSLSQEIGTHIGDLQEIFRQKIEVDATKTTLFNQLHQELTSYREDFVFKHILSRIFDDLLRLYDQLSNGLKSEALERLSREDLIERLQRTQGQVTKILERQGVELIKHDLPMQFDAANQEALQTVAVSTMDENEQVKVVIRSGFTYRGHVLRPEKVVVGIFQQPEE